MKPHPRKEEADAIGVSLEYLLEIEQNRKDEVTAERRGIEPWEVRMRRSGATEPEIEARKEKRRQEIQNIIGE